MNPVKRLATTTSRETDIATAARDIGTDYVLSFKPNPAILATDDWDADKVRQYMRESLAQARGCRVEVIMKDISTVRYEPRRLWEWGKITLEEAERSTRIRAE